MWVPNPPLLREKLGAEDSLSILTLYQGMRFMIRTCLSLSHLFCCEYFFILTICKVTQLVSIPNSEGIACGWLYIWGMCGRKGAQESPVTILVNFKLNSQYLSFIFREILNYISWKHSTLLKYLLKQNSLNKNTKTNSSIVLQPV